MSGRGIRSGGASVTCPNVGGCSTAAAGAAAYCPSTCMVAEPPGVGGVWVLVVLVLLVPMLEDAPLRGRGLQLSAACMGDCPGACGILSHHTGNHGVGMYSAAE